MPGEAKKGRVGGMEVSGERNTRRYESCENKEILEKDNQHMGKETPQVTIKKANIFGKETLTMQTLKCFYANVRSIISIDKRLELENYVENEAPDIIGITETWAKTEIDDSELALDGYVMFRKDRENQRIKGHGEGGVLLYVKDTIKAVERPDMRNVKFKESVWSEIHYGANRLLVGVCYRPPDVSEETEEGLYEIIGRANKETTIIMGDFNYHIDWEESEGEKWQDKKFLEVFNDAFLQQHVVELTREGSKYILDLIMTSEEKLVQNIKIGENFHTSDHKIIRWSLTMGDYMEAAEKPKRYNYFKANYGEIKRKLKDMDIVNKVKNLGANESWLILRKSLKEVIEECIPMSANLVKKRLWVTRKVQRKRRAKQKAWKKYSKMKKSMECNEGRDQDPNIMNRIIQLKEQYVKKRNNSSRANKEAIQKYEMKLAENIKNDSKSFYKYVRNRQKKKDIVGPLTNDEGDIIMDDKETAEELNKYFGSVFSQEDVENIPEAPVMFKGAEDQRLENVLFTREKIIQELEKLHTDKSPGNDEIHPMFLKELREELGEILEHIMEKSMETGEIPQNWRDAVVVPLFKKGNRNEARNYRPVSLTSIVCKIMEKIIKEKMVEHLKAHQVIGNSQHGFIGSRTIHQRTIHQQTVHQIIIKI